MSVQILVKAAIDQARERRALAHSIRRSGLAGVIRTAHTLEREALLLDGLARSGARYDRLVRALAALRVPIPHAAMLDDLIDAW